MGIKKKGRSCSELTFSSTGAEKRRREKNKLLIILQNQAIFDPYFVSHGNSLPLINVHHILQEEIPSFR